MIIKSFIQRKEGELNKIKEELFAKDNDTRNDNKIKVQVLDVNNKPNVEEPKPVTEKTEKDKHTSQKQFPFFGKRVTSYKDFYDGISDYNQKLQEGRWMAIVDVNKHFTITEASSCLMKSLLIRRKEEIENYGNFRNIERKNTISDLYLKQGTVIHEYIEDVANNIFNNEDVITEDKIGILKVEVENFILTGKCDIYLKTAKHLIEIKTGRYKSKSHKIQLGLEAFLFNSNGYEVNDGSIYYPFLNDGEHEYVSNEELNKIVNDRLPKLKFLRECLDKDHLEFTDDLNILIETSECKFCERKDMCDAFTMGDICFTRTKNDKKPVVNTVNVVSNNNNDRSNESTKKVLLKRKLK